MLARTYALVSPLLVLAACGGAPSPAVPPASSIAVEPLATKHAAPPVAHAAPKAYAVKIERGVVATMRDGTKLYADVYRPDAPGQFPVAMTRTPYDRRGREEKGREGAARGFVVIAQDVRGRFQSEGEWYPFKHEAEDGYDSVEWAAALPFANGKVGVYGGSYVGATTILAATAHPPHLAAIVPVLTASDYHDGWTYQGGAFEEWFDRSWTAGLLEDTVRRRLDRSGAVDLLHRAPLVAYPLMDAATAASLAPYFHDWVAHPANDGYWRALSIEERWSQINVPAMHIGGWYDIFIRGTLRNFVGLRAGAATDEAKRGQRLVVGPANHQHDKGDVSFGAATDTWPDVFTWFAAVMSGGPEQYDKPVQIFVMGKNVWRGEDEWPLARAKPTRFHLHAGGTLDANDPRAEKPDSFVYDPQDPVPTRGGPLCCGAEYLSAGPLDQRTVESRKDLLLYSTAPFDNDTEVTGPVSVDLFVSSSARDTDFTAKLVDVWPNGLAQNLTDGIVRMRWRDGGAKPSFLEPGKIYRVTIDLAGTSNVFLAGHRMRVEIASSNYPRFSRNLNTEEQPETGTRSVKATNTVHHDAAHASALVVPIVPAP
jgi:putative CocE/NonD family hydrolase